MKRLALATLALAASTCASLAGAQTVLTVSSWLPPSHAPSATQKDWCDLLEKNTSGKMKCNILPRGVSAPPGTFDAVKNGLADISYTVHGYTPGRFVTSQMAEFPFLGNSSESISVAFNRIAAKHPEFAGNVASVDTTGYWRDVAESPGVQGFHYNNNAETYMLVGEAMGKAMVELKK